MLREYFALKNLLLRLGFLLYYVAIHCCKFYFSAYVKPNFAGNFTFLRMD